LDHSLSKDLNAQKYENMLKNEIIPAIIVIVGEKTLKTHDPIGWCTSLGRCLQLFRNSFS